MSKAAEIQTKLTPAPPKMVSPLFLPPRIIPGDLLPEPTDTVRRRRRDTGGYGFQWFNMNPKKSKTSQTTTTTTVVPPTGGLSRFGATGFFDFGPGDDDSNESM